MDKPILSKQAFWDVDMEKIAYQKDLLYITEKVIDRGSFQDFIALVKFYGDKKISKEIINTKCLGDKEINFCCIVFKLEIADFKYYCKGQSRPHLKFTEDFNGFNYLN